MSKRPSEKDWNNIERRAKRLYSIRVAWNLGRDYIGFDTNRDYYKIARKALYHTHYRRFDNFT